MTAKSQHGVQNTALPASSPAKKRQASLSRRSFLKLTGAAALSLSLPGCLLPGQPDTSLPPRLTNPDNLWKNVADYTYMWWAYGFRSPQRIYNIQTSRFGLSFDAGIFNLRKLGIFKQPVSEDEALTQDNRMIEALPDVSLEMVIEVDGKRFKAAPAANNTDNYKIIETGKYFQRRWQCFPVFDAGAPPLNTADSGLEVSAWHDRAAFILRLITKQSLENAVLEVALQIPAEFAPGLPADSNSLASECSVFANPDGNGYVFLKANPEAKMAVSAQKIVVRLEVHNWQQDEQRSVGIIVYPARDVKQTLSAAVASENSPLQIEAQQILPAAHDLDVTYDRETGWHAISLRNDGDITDYAESSNDHFEQVAITLHNPGSTPRMARLNFAKDGLVFGITGLSALLRDSDHEPLGIPVQISKNWHKSNSGSPVHKRFEGQWFHGLTQLTIPAGESISLEYVSVNALWGTLPAASHAQLCLVGWGSNQQWDQTAIGSWGESLCFEPDQGQNGGAVLDTRPLMVSRSDGQGKWGWTNNVGGADFLVYYDPNVDKQWNSRMRTRYHSYCPNLTEVTYAGTTQDQKIDLQYTVTLYRGDDITRGLYKFRYDVKESTPFTRLILFQCGGDDYSYTAERKFAYGDETGLLKEWDTQWGFNTYRTEFMELTGAVPWISMHQAVQRSPGGAWANRGLVLRRWNAQLGGKPARPWFAERGIFANGADSSLVDILPPPGLNELLPGDFVEAEIEHVIVPQFAADYYGPNENLRQALSTNENTWKMIYREALGNHLEVQVTRGGTVLHSYPIQIHSQGDEIAFSVTGGLGYVPATISGLNDYRGFKLEYQVKGTWIELDQSHYGKDFWQADFDAQMQRWQLTYSLPLDTPQDERQARQFRLVRSTS
jgi:hypothetical protein